MKKLLDFVIAGASESILNLGFISLLYLDLYVLGDDALISKGSFINNHISAVYFRKK